MDIRELRIDDRVSHNGDTGEVVEIKTNHVRLLFKDDTSYLYNVNELEPIPLTDELLLNIGAKEIKIVGHHYLYIGNKEQSILLHHSRYAYVLTAEYYRIAVRKPIKYLHQLQHELFDAGIELKIEL